MAIKTQFSDYSIRDKIAHLKLNRPPVNALNSDAAKEYNANVLVLSAEGKSFCAGADLKERINTPGDETLGMVKQINDLTRGIAQLPIPPFAVREVTDDPQFTGGTLIELSEVEFKEWMKT